MSPARSQALMRRRRVNRWRSHLRNKNGGGRKEESAIRERIKERIKKEEEESKGMGKIPVKMRAVVYGLSPFQQKIMPGLWKDLPGKIHHKVSENWISTVLLLGPLLGTYGYVQHYLEKEKLAHRY